MANPLLLFSDYTFQTVALGSLLMGVLSGILGSFAVLRKQSLLGDGVSHAALPGVVFAFMLTGTKNTEILLLGALGTGLIATALMMNIVKHSRVKFDAALAVVMSVFFGLGLVLFTYVQKSPNANQAGLKRFIYGQAAAMLERDVYFMQICAVVLLFIVILFFKEFKLLTFDSDFAKSIGMPIGWMNAGLSLLIVLAIIIGLQTVGAILMSAMLIAPAAAARQWSSKLWQMITLAAVFGGLSGVLGTWVSSSFAQMPTGPAIVVCVSVITIISLLFAPKRGLLSRLTRQHNQKRKLEAERG
ncbi:metal ABC transporter permease [Scatolibacter rhodanostii]|uniref:metal ABC transporter permease n=1 Tax=Scatolibacter rhodanostii TaxID=2014781 RepID=UPI000C06A13C|nr:iron chelate uptake ABC transporter family permease subunit [Scatolibacter rhodanostii]